MPESAATTLSATPRRGTRSVPPIATKFYAGTPVVTWRSILAVGAIGFMAGPVLAQQRGALYPDLSHPDGMPDPYSGIYNKAGINCCNGHDCRRVLDELDFVIEMEGGYILKETGEFIAEFQVGNSPDEHWHICRGISYELKTNRHDKIRCLLIPPGGV